MGIVNYEIEEKKFIEQRDIKQKELLERLAVIKDALSDNVYDYYLSLIKLERNAWNEESSKYYICGELFGEIISFNLQYYLATFLFRSVDKNLFRVSNLGNDSTTHINGCYNYGKLYVINRPLCSDKTGFNWELEFNMPKEVDENFNERRLIYILFVETNYFNVNEFSS